MKTRLVCLTGLALCLSLPVISASAQEKKTTTSTSTTTTKASTDPATFSGAKLLKYAKVGIVEAPAIALKASPGIITDEELAAETARSALRHHFHISQRKVVK